MTIPSLFTSPAHIWYGDGCCDEIAKLTAKTISETLIKLSPFISPWIPTSIEPDWPLDEISLPNWSDTIVLTNSTGIFWPKVADSGIY